MASLSRQLGSAIVARGAHLSITKRLPTTELTRIFKELTDFIVGKIAGCENSTRKVRAGAMFKPLLNLMIGMSGREGVAV